MPWGYMSQRENNLPLSISLSNWLQEFSVFHVFIFLNLVFWAIYNLTCRKGKITFLYLSLLPCTHMRKQEWFIVQAITLLYYVDFLNENNHFYCGSSGAKCNTKLKNDEIRPLCLPFPERSFESNKAAILQTWWVFVALWRFLRHLSNTKKKLQKAALPQKLLCLPVPLSLTTRTSATALCVWRDRSRTAHGSEKLERK